MNNETQALSFEDIRTALVDAWSVETAVQWTPQRPAAGQCNVTTVVVHDLFGGEILRTRIPKADHYYNRLAGVVVDFTADQFANPIVYDDIPATRAEAMACVEAKEYQVLRDKLVAALEDRQPIISDALPAASKSNG